MPKDLAVIKNKPAPSLQQLVNQETKNRAILTKFIDSHMKDGSDYGRIHISKTCVNKYACEYKKNPGHFSKPSLFKPGAEKFASLMHLRATYKKDEDSWAMGGSVAGTFYYVCYLLKENGNIAGEGRGAASIAEKGSPNTAVKLAQKRAKVDAVLSTGGLSDFFTQDLEDLVENGNNQQSVNKPQLPAQPKVFYITPGQQRTIRMLLEQKGKTDDNLKDFCENAFKKQFMSLSIKEADIVIKKLEALPDYGEEEKLGETDAGVPTGASYSGEDEVDPDEAEKGIDKMKEEGKSE